MNEIYCTHCGERVDDSRRCPSCNVENEFLESDRPATLTSFTGTIAGPWEGRREGSAIDAPPGRPDARDGPPSRPSREAEAQSAADPEPAADEEPERSQFFAFGLSREAAGGIVGGAPPASVGEAGSASTGNAPDVEPEGTMLLPDDDGASSGREEEGTMLLDELENDPVLVRLERLSPPLEGQVVELRRGVTTFGTRDADVLFDRQVDRAISRRHAQIDTVQANGETRCTVLDLGSSNGTYVDGQKPQGAVELRDGSHLKLGNVEFLIRVESR